MFDPQRDLIAEGTYSRVYHATDVLLQRDICIKLFRKELVAGSALIHELSRAGVLFHPNVCSFYDLVEIDEINVIGETEVQPIGIIEYMNGGTITDYIARQHPDGTHTLRLIKDIIRGLSYLHSIGRPHLDIKPGNLLIKLTAGEPVAKITDFLNSENLHTRSVPMAIDPQQICYRAPECFESSYGEQSLHADIWSLGIVVYELVSGKKLFWNEGDTVEKVIRNVCYTDYWSAVHELPEPYMSFVKKCLVRNAAERTVSLEELTLILDGHHTSDVKPVVEAPVASSSAAPAAAPTLTQETVPAEPALADSAKDFFNKELAQAIKGGPDGWSIRIVAGSLLILLCIWGFIIKSMSTGGHTNGYANGGAIDTNGIIASVTHRVIYDTVKVVQIRQRAASPEFTAQARAAAVNAPRPEADAMPTLPSFSYLWSGKPYYFDLKTPLMSDVEYELYSDNAAVTTLGKNTFYVKPTAVGPMDVMVLQKGTHAKITEKVYNVKSRAVPVATIGDDITGGFVSPKMLLAKLTMSAKSDSGSYRIKSFHMACKSGSCDIQDVSDNGTFNESMIKFLRDVKPGEQLYFDNIIAEDDKGQSVKLDPFQITTY